MTIFKINTNVKQQCIDITSKIEEIVKESNVKEGVCFVYTPHATGGIIINENWDPNIGDDFINAVSKLIPHGIWKHDRIDGNGSAHIKSAIIGPSEFIPIEDNKLQLGRWQNIMFTEFDGPRNQRIVNVKILK
jgi:secondary thiamine-phosphate synthase enzyme